MSEESIAVEKVCHDWWLSEVSADTGHCRKTRAELRRADTPLEALGVSAVHDLNRELTSAGWHKRKNWPDRLSLIAIALAHLKEDQTEALASRFGFGDPPKLSRIRFNTLIRTESPRGLMRPLVRAISIVDNSANVRRLARDLYWWADQDRITWCFEYYGSADSKPNTTNDDKETNI
ncbi:MAG: type I-E CRISPR-associated protein Cse2/CasB [Aestuariivita sp.]|nr:type I-E CRISPR-associated protein Cse2/CasB [Aestuariivita sp.]